MYSVIGKNLCYCQPAKFLHMNIFVNWENILIFLWVCMAGERSWRLKLNCFSSVCGSLKCICILKLKSTLVIWIFGFNQQDWVATRHFFSFTKSIVWQNQIFEPFYCCNSPVLWKSDRPNNFFCIVDLSTHYVTICCAIVYATCILLTFNRRGGAKTSANNCFWLLVKSSQVQAFYSPISYLMGKNWFQK